jgi:hypothetical protein
VSCFTVAKVHIDVVVQALCEREIVTQDPDEVGAMLWRENYSAYAGRYLDSESVLQPPEYTYRRPPSPVPFIVIFKLAQCLEYNSTDHDPVGSTALKWLEELSTRLEAAGYGYNHPDYEKAPWIVDSWSDIPKEVAA